MASPISRNRARAAQSYLHLRSRIAPAQEETAKRFYYIIQALIVLTNQSLDDSDACSLPLPILRAHRGRFCRHVCFDPQSRSFYFTVRARAPSATQPTPWRVPLKSMPLRCIRPLRQLLALTDATPPCCRAEAHTHIVFSTGYTSLRRGNVHTASPFTCGHPVPSRTHIFCRLRNLLHVFFCLQNHTNVC
jgi:hypothetical protein